MNRTLYAPLVVTPLLALLALLGGLPGAVPWLGLAALAWVVVWFAGAALADWQARRTAAE
jgi:hypothetical protein